MAENKKSFLLYCDFINTFEELSDQEAGQLIKHIFRYVNDQDPVTDDKLIKIAFGPIKQQLKRDLLKWDNYIKKQRENGLKGGRPSIKEGTQITQPFIQEPKKADTVTVTVNDTVINNKAIALVDVPDEPQLKKEYGGISESFEKIDAKERWIKVRDFIRDHKPDFIEPYFDAWNIFSINIQLSKIPQQITDKRRKKFATRIREPDFKKRFLEILEKIKTSPFAKGDNQRGWKVGIEFILDSQENYTKILENRYDF